MSPPKQLIVEEGVVVQQQHYLRIEQQETMAQRPQRPALSTSPSDWHAVGVALREGAMIVDGVYARGRTLATWVRLIGSQPSDHKVTTFRRSEVAIEMLSPQGQGLLPHKIQPAQGSHPDDQREHPSLN